MKKNVFAVVSLVLALSAATVGTAFAKPSGSTGGTIVGGGSSSSGGGSGSGSSVGHGYYGGGASSAPTTQGAGNAQAAVAGTTNAAGKTIIGGTTAVYFRTDKAAAVAGLPETTVAQINGINNGQALAETVKDVDLNGYNALIQTQAFIMEDTQGNVMTASTAVTLNVPNLVNGLNNVQILFYNNATGKWEVITPTAVDFNGKTVTVNLPGSGTLSVIYKK